MPVQPARAELVALLTAMRPDWPTSNVEKALWNCTHSGMTFDQTFRSASLVVLNPNAGPDAIPRVEQIPARTRPGDYIAGVKAARQALLEQQEQ